MIRTCITELLDIKYPIFQGGMAWVSEASLAAAVSEAGGLGVISAMNAGPEWLRGEIAKARKLTNKKFAVNIMLLSPHTDSIAKVVIEEGITIVTTGAGMPSRYMKDWLAAGIKVIPVVPSVGIARLVERSGAVAVIAEGGEAGGHIGETTTMALIPQVCDAVKIPVVAAGGIADGRGAAAALMLGAGGVQVGTAFLVANECNIHENYKKRILKAKDIDTVITGRRLGHPVRSLRSPFSRRFANLENDVNVSNSELENLGLGALRNAVVEGDEQNGCFMAGQIAGLINEEKSVKAIIQEMFQQAEQLIIGANKCII